MRKIVIRSSLILVIAVAAAAAIVGLGWLDRRDDSPTAPQRIRQAALAEARRQEKLLLLWFSAEYSDLAQMMAQYHADDEVAEVLGKYFVIKMVDIHEDFGGGQVYLDAGGVRGVPAMSLLDAEGRLLADSGPDEATNFGFPDTPEQLDAYCAALKKACPAIADEELQLLRRKLVEVRGASAADGAATPGASRTDL